MADRSTDLWSGDDLVGTGPNRAKLRRPPPSDGAISGRLVLVTATTPTRAGEGKTVTAIGLADAVARRGRRAAVTLRTSSLGPTLGMKGGGAGGGAAHLEPLDEALLGLGSDLGAVEAANNLLAAAIDHELRPGANDRGIVASSITWRRVVDVDDRALRNVDVHPGGSASDPGRPTGFDITAASEVMAVLSLARDPQDLRSRLGRIVVGHDDRDRPVRAEDLGVAGTMAALLREACWPNVLRTAAGTPALVHGGAFANIAHGCASVIAERLAMERAEIVVTEAGFGADLGAQKRLDLVTPAGGPVPDCIVLVTTVRALADHGRRLHGSASAAGTGPERGDVVAAVEAGAVNLERHVANLRRSGRPVVVAVNRFPDDPDDAVARIAERARAAGAAATAAHTAYLDGGAGCAELAEAVESALADAPPTTATAGALPTVPAGPLDAAVEALAIGTYGAADVAWSAGALAQLERLRADGFGDLPPCVAKTQLSLSHDPTLAGAPSGYTFPVRAVQVRAGAGFVTVYAGDIVTMPGLPEHPRFLDIDVAPDGSVLGLV